MPRFFREPRAYLWKKLGYSPRVTVDPQTTRKAYRRMFVAGVLGGFFATIVRNIPLDLKQLKSVSFSSPYLLDVFLKYGYVLWFLAFFAISNLRNNEPWKTVARKDILFDVLQVALGWISAYFLGFLVTGDRYGLFGYVVTNAAIFTICLVSLAFSDIAPINRLRRTGLALSSFSLITLGIGSSRIPDVWTHSILEGLQLCLWIILYAYGEIRADSMEERNEKPNAAVSAAPR